MSGNQTEQLSLYDMLAKAGITQRKIAEKANVSQAAVYLVVAGKSKSKRIENLIRTEAGKVLSQNQKEVVKP